MKRIIKDDKKIIKSQQTQLDKSTNMGLNGNEKYGKFIQNG
jgi:hypothetical protein